MVSEAARWCRAAAHATLRRTAYACSCRCRLLRLQARSAPSACRANWCEHAACAFYAALTAAADATPSLLFSSPHRHDCTASPLRLPCGSAFTARRMKPLETELRAPPPAAGGSSPGGSDDDGAPADTSSWALPIGLCALGIFIACACTRAERAHTRLARALSACASRRVRRTLRQYAKLDDTPSRSQTQTPTGQTSARLC